jgi:hypothetical protein
MRITIYRLFSRLTMALLAIPVCEHFVEYLTYQRKRVVRRRTEAKLRQMGLYGDEVQTGPFRGMKYPGPDTWVSCRFGKIIGCYEFEVFPWIERLVAEGRPVTSVVNIGASDGYFAVGLGRLFPDARIFPFEADPDRVGSLNELARLNSVTDRFAAGLWGDPAALNALDVGDCPLVVCDVDGYEKVLMDPAAVPWLTRAIIILEVHEFLAPNLSSEEKARFEKRHSFLVRDIGALIRSRFENTHRIETALVSATPVDRFPLLQNLEMGEVLALTESDRANIHPWFFLTPK